MPETIHLTVPNTAETAQEEPLEAPQSAEQEPEVQEDVQDSQAPESGSEDDAQEPESFSREYVQKLRDESAKYRTRAKAADELAQRLHVELVRGLGRLADPSDLPFQEEHLESPEALQEAVEELLRAKPHLAVRRVVGSIGQGQGNTAPTGVSLGGLLRAHA